MVKLKLKMLGLIGKSSVQMFKILSLSAGRAIKMLMLHLDKNAVLKVFASLMKIGLKQDFSIKLKLSLLKENGIMEQLVQF